MVTQFVFRPWCSSWTGRRLAVAFLALALIAVSGCGGSGADTSSGTSGASEAVPTSESSASGPAADVSPAGPDAVRVPRYPSPAAADAAFVSEIATLGTTYVVAPVDLGGLAGWAREMAGKGRTLCAEMGGGLSPELLQRVLGTHVSDQTDRVAFAVEAAYAFCPERLSTLGQGVAATGPLEYVRVDDRCGRLGSATDVTVIAEGFTRTGKDVKWTLAIENNGVLPALVIVEEQMFVGKAKRALSWGSASVPEGSIAYGVPAGDRVTRPAGIDGGHQDWTGVRYRIPEGGYLPLKCSAQLKTT